MSYHRATRGMYTTDGAGQPFLTDEVEDEVNRRLEENGINQGDEGYDEAFQEELSKLEQETIDQYNEMETDRALDRLEDRESGWY